MYFSFESQKSKLFFASDQLFQGEVNQVFPGLETGKLKTFTDQMFVQNNISSFHHIHIITHNYVYAR